MARRTPSEPCLARAVAEASAFAAAAPALAAGVGAATEHAEANGWEPCGNPRCTVCYPAAPADAS